MDRATALSRLSEMCAALEEPVLEPATLERLVDLAARPDVDGLLPADSGWVATYDLNAAAAAGWRIKAGRVAHRFNFTTDGQSFDVGALRESFLAMADQMGRKGLWTISTAGASEVLEPVEEYDPFSEGWPA